MTFRSGSRILVLTALLLAAACENDLRSAEQSKNIPARVAAATPNHDLLVRIALQDSVRKASPALAAHAAR